MTTVRYRLDADDRLVEVDEAWLLFARRNGWRVTERELIGRRIWDFVSGGDVVEVYRLLFSRVRAGRKSVRLPFRCDAPERRRFMELRVRGLPDGGLRLEGETRREEPRSPVPFEHARQAEQALTTLCSWCQRVAVGDRWLEVEDALATTDLFVASERPRFTHGLCSACAACLEAEVAGPDP